VGKPYPYIGLPLDIDIAKVLIVELFEGQQCRAKTIVQKVGEEHRKQGGLDPIKHTVRNRVRTALFSMKDNKQANNEPNKDRKYGYWDIYQLRSNRAIKVPQQVVGTGKRDVYLFHYPTYREHAELTGKNSWYCKIGQTVDFQKRITHNKTVIPEQPIIALVMRTNKPKKLEAVLHELLKHKQVETAPGTEWFNTSPDEVKHLYEILIEDYR